jgi:hypothetical protein
MSVIKTIRMFAAAAAAIGLSACAGAPPPLMIPYNDDGTYGFRQKSVSATEYEVTYFGPMIQTELTVRRFLDRISAVAEKTSQDLAVWRAAEIAQEHGYKGFKVRDAGSIVRHYIVGRDYENVPVGVFQNVTILHYEYASWTYFRGEAKLTVALTNDSGEGIFDANETAAAAAAQYQGATSRAIMAETYYYFGPDAWFQGYDETHKEAPLFESVPVPKPGPPGKPLGQPYYIP